VKHALYSQTLLIEAEELLAARNIQSAIRKFDLAELNGADPNRCSGGRWMAHMLCGNFPAGWRESDTIYHRGGIDPQCLWHGEDVAGQKVVIRCLHGYGDAVQFLRYAPQLNRLAASVIWEVPPALLKLAPYFHGVDRVASWEATPPIDRAEWNIQIEIMELPYLFRTRIADLPLATKYIHLPAEALRKIARQMKCTDLPQIGLVWAAGEWNTSRSLPPYMLRPLLDRSDCEFWNLQGGSSRNEYQQCALLHDIKACNDGILSLAAVISKLDLVITVDTLAAHLAGALNVPAWLLLQHTADWRWMTGRNDSPWYPSVRLFRQPSAGDWVSVLCSVANALDEWLRLKAQRFIA
jgi:hypothetical protein